MTSKANYGGNGVKYVDSFRLWLNINNYLLKINGASLVAQMVKRLPAMQETWVRSLSWEGPLEEGMATLSCILFLENPHGQRSLVSYSPWGCKSWT